MSANQERPTPITDAAERSASYFAMNDITAKIVPSKVARDLERQLAEANDTIQHLRMEDGLMKFYNCEDERKDALTQLAEAREQRDRLADACQKLMAVVGPPNATIEQCWAGVDEIDAAWESGKATLAAVEAESN